MAAESQRHDGSHDRPELVEGPGSPSATLPDLLARIRPRRRILGMSAVLLPFLSDGSIDWRGLADHVERTTRAGLCPALNMDTGYVQLLAPRERARVLEVARAHTAPGFVAGVVVDDRPGAAFDRDAYARGIEGVVAQGGRPIVFPSHGLSGLAPDAWLEAHRDLASVCEGLFAFELGPMFVPYGRIHSLETYRGLLEIPGCLGAKHSSLSRQLEWQRLALRDELRPGFLVLTGNDLAIDMVMYGSDYLLGLSTFAPDLFARRDALWEAGDPAFCQLNDTLQYLGHFAFREPVPAYKHDAALFLQLRGWIGSDRPHPRAARRPDGDREVLAGIARRLELETR